MYTVLGAGGLIGNALKESLTRQGNNVYSPLGKGEDWLKEVLSYKLGHVFYCIGLTADFRSRPFETVEAHVYILQKLLKEGQFDSLTYLSSTRVYESSAHTNESANLLINPTSSGHLYNLSKMMGESLCINSGRKAKIVRLSNVYHQTMEGGNFLSLVLKEAAHSGSVTFKTSATSTKDFISLEEVVRLLPLIGLNGQFNIYNLASGGNVTNANIAELLRKLGVEVSFSDDAAEWIFPRINIERLQTEFGKPDNSLEADLPLLFNYFRLKV